MRLRRYVAKIAFGVSRVGDAPQLLLELLFSGDAGGIEATDSSVIRRAARLARDSDGADENESDAGNAAQDSACSIIHVLLAAQTPPF